MSIHKKFSSLLTTITIIIIMLTIITIYTKRSEITWVNAIIPISSVTTNKNIVAIACNVYEGNEELTKIIKVLNKENVRISFFIGGTWAYKNPEVLLMLKNNKQDIQNHGYYHKRPSTLNKQNNIKEIKDTENYIYKITNVKTTLFEPPYGDYDENALSIINSIGYKVITWSIDTIDWRQDASQDIILKRIEKKLHPGAIILTHPKKVTSKSIEGIIRMLKNKGYEITTVSDLIQK